MTLAMKLKILGLKLQHTIASNCKRISLYVDTVTLNQVTRWPDIKNGREFEFSAWNNPRNLIISVFTAMAE